MRNIKIATPTLLLATLALGGCVENDPLIREGLWHPAHSNRADLTMSAAYPADLVRGTGVAGSDGQLAAAAVNRLRTDKIKKLPEAGISEIKVTGGGDNNSAGGSAGGN